MHIHWRTDRYGRIGRDLNWSAMFLCILGLQSIPIVVLRHKAVMDTCYTVLAVRYNSLHILLRLDRIFRMWPLLDHIGAVSHAEFRKKGELGRYACCGKRATGVWRADCRAGNQWTTYGYWKTNVSGSARQFRPYWCRLLIEDDVMVVIFEKNGLIQRRLILDAAIAWWIFINLLHYSELNTCSTTNSKIFFNGYERRNTHKHCRNSHRALKKNACWWMIFIAINMPIFMSNVLWSSKIFYDFVQYRHSKTL